MIVFIPIDSNEDQFSWVVFDTKEKAQHWIDTIGSTPGNNGYTPYGTWEIKEVEVQ